MKKFNPLFWFPLIILIILAFKNLFIGSPIWGDAPFFYKEGLNNLISEPQAWTERGQILGGINNFLFIYPLMLVYGLMHKFLSAENNTIIITLFYLPSIILSLTGSILLARHWNQGVKTQFFTALFYLLNTYYLMAFDGGVVGIVLAYGLFPFSLLTLFRLAKKPGYWRFVVALLINQLLIIADPRIAAISFLTFIVLETLSWILKHDKKISKPTLFALLLLLICLVGVNFYWLIPLFKLDSLSPVTISGASRVNIKNAFTLYQPHWPGNIFGVLSSPSLSFYVLPVLIFISSLLNKKNHLSKTLFGGYIVTSILTTGIYLPFISIVPLGFAFRDPTKLFIPGMLLAGILLGQLAEKINKKTFTLILIAYLISLVSPVFTGHLNFVLSNRKHSKSLETIKTNLSNEKDFYRSAWIPETHPLTFHTEQTPAIDAKSLSTLRPLARINTGSSDLFNFFNNEGFNTWFDIYGIRFLILSGNQRTINPSSNEQKDTQNLIKLLDNSKHLTRENWAQDIPVYKNSNTLPKIFGSDRLVAVIGADDVYNTNADIPFIFFEDGLFDPEALNGLPKDSVAILFNNKDKADLAMSFLQKFFISPQKSINSQWAVWGPKEYLHYKYQLLIRDISFQEFDYNQGIALSTQPGEKITFKLRVPKDGEYVLAIRSFSKKDSNPLKISFTDKEYKVPASNTFQWFTLPVVVKSGKVNLEAQNTNGTQVLNVVALIPKKDFDKATEKAQIFLSHFPVINRKDLDSDFSDNSYEEIKYTQISPTRYELNLEDSEIQWVIFSNSFHPRWILTHSLSDRKSYSAIATFSSINAFPKRKEWTTAILHFDGQKDVRWGIYWSTISVILILITLIFLKNKK